jgi:hypothetical protein
VTQPRTRRIGPDQIVTRGDDGMVVITAMEMPDWNVRQHRATLIRYEGTTWRVAAKTTTAGKIHYELVRWDVADHERTGRQIDYNAEYVALRDQAAPRIRARSRVTGLLRWVSPFIGFLPARTKARLELTHGIDPVATTFQSVFLEFLITLGSFAVATIGIIARAGTIVYLLPGGPGIPAVQLVVLGIVVGIDGSVRYDRILREERPPPGFYEWLVTRRPSPR